MTDQPTSNVPPAPATPVSMPSKPESMPSQPDSPATPAPEPTQQGEDKKFARSALIKRVGGAFLAILAFFVFRAVTADDGSHGIKAGECIAAVGTDDFKKVDCSDSTSVGTVTFVQTDTATDETSALALCDKHGAQGAFTSAVSDGGKGSVICVADPK